MEMSFDASHNFRPVIHRARRSRRAHWWFQQMRQVVNQALDRTPAPAARPEQIYFSLPRRHAVCEGGNPAERDALSRTEGGEGVGNHQ